MPQFLRASLLITTVIAVLACGGDTPRGVDTDPTVLAWTGGAAGSEAVDEVITAEALDDHILQLPPKERPQPGEDLESWYREQIRDLVITRVLRREATVEGLPREDSFQDLQREAEKQIAFQLCLAELRGDIEPITEDDLRERYAALAGEREMPERRSVFQIFLRRGDGAEARIQALRDRVLAGDGFQRLAAEVSESETRHRKGWLGFLIRGQLPAGFERVVFELEEGVPSEPVATREGYHLFLVDQVLPAHDPSFEELLPVLRERLAGERREALLEEIDARVEPPGDATVLTRDELAEVVTEGDTDRVVLDLGDLTWTLGDLRQQLGAWLARQDRSGTPTVELAWRVLEQARRQEEIYLACRRQDQVPQDLLETRLATWRERALVDAWRQRRLQDLALEDESRLRLYYENNIGDFSTPPTWTVSRLIVPEAEGAAKTMAIMTRLEEAARSDDSENGPDLAQLQSELGGQLETFEPMRLAELARIDPKLPPLVSPLEAGDLAAPYRSEAGLEIVEVVDRGDAEPQPFEEVRQRVAARYVHQYTTELYERLQEDILRRVDLEINDTAVAEWSATGLGPRDVTVEELDALLAED